jgi:ubiquinone biosynthesis protein COQ4
MHPHPRPLDRIHTVIDATRSAIADPRDTKQAFRIAEALSFGNPERLLGKFRRHPTGARLLAERDELLDVLTDRAALEAMPDGSLARAYLAFLDSEGISAAGLVEASMDGTDPAFHGGRDDLSYTRRRMRDSHDLWHTVTGYRGDLLGEASLLAFTFAQTGHPGIGFLAGIGAVVADDRRFRRMIADGYRRGKRAAWLPPTDWAALLPQPLDQVRRQLGVDPVPAYEPVRDWDQPSSAQTPPTMAA